MDKELFALIAFSSSDLIGYHRFQKIKSHFSKISEFLEQSVDFQTKFLDLKSGSTQKILLSMKENAAKIIETCQKKDITLLSYTDPLYPTQLKTIPDPPYLLYIQGILQPHIPLVAVIGTRKFTPEAEEINKWFSQAFVEYGIGVISGLAYGHDSIAARTVLQNNGYTIGILGTAIDVVYPSKYRYLFDQIKERGALISEYPPGMASTKWRFPRRNRIVSGMSQSVLVVQAPEKSGTMITVRMAADQGRDVYVIPGNPLNPANNGTNGLIQKGAKVALHPNDIIKDMMLSAQNKQTLQFIQKNTLPKTVKTFFIDPTLPLEEQKILQITEKPKHIDEIVRELGINTSMVTAILTMMEIKGLLLQKPGQLYLREDQ